MGCIWVDKMATSHLFEESKTLKLRSVYDGHSNCGKLDMTMNPEKKYKSLKNVDAILQLQLFCEHLFIETLKLCSVSMTNFSNIYTKSLK